MENTNKNILNNTEICIEPTIKNFPNGITEYIFVYGKYYKFSRIHANGNYCYILIEQPLFAGKKRRRRTPTPTPQNRICTGDITFVASNTCNIGAPENFDAAFVLNPFGELFVANDPCGAGDHNYSEFLCSDSVATIEAKLLASLQAQFVGKVDFTVTRNSGAGVGFDDNVLALALQSDGKIIAGGTFTSYGGTPSSRLIRLNSDFTIDTVTIGTGFDERIEALAIDSSGNIYVGGDFSSYNGTASSLIIKLNPDFTINTTAVGTGFTAFAIVKSIVIDNSGNIIVGGTFTDYNGTSSERIIKLNPDLTINTVAVGTGFNNSVFSLALQPDGKIVVGGQFTTYNGSSSERIIRLNNDLTIDTLALGAGFDNSVFSLSLQSDGKIISGGDFTSYDGTASSKLIRLNSDFTIDTIAIGTGFDSRVNAIKIDSSGNIIVGGNFTDYNGTSSERIIKLNPDLTINTVAVGAGFDSNVFALSLQPDGKIVVGGGFQHYDTHRADFIIRLNSNLTIDTAFDDVYTITVTFTDSSTNPAPTSLLGTILENCVSIQDDVDMNLTCIIS